MDDLRLGRALRAIRIRRALRQWDVAAAAGLSDATVSRIERGDLGSLSLAAVRRVAGVLEVRIDMVPRWRGADLDRLLARRHSGLAEDVSRHLRAAGWDVRPEVSFSIYGERGVVDLLAWHPARRALLVVELKTEIVDVGETLGVLDRKRRLGPRIASEIGWRAANASCCLILSDGSTNHRRVHAFSAVLRSALPQDGRRLRGWLRNPAGPVAALAFWSDRHPGSTNATTRPVRRVRRAGKDNPAADLSVDQSTIAAGSP